MSTHKGLLVAVEGAFSSKSAGGRACEGLLHVQAG